MSRMVLWAVAVAVAGCSGSDSPTGTGDLPAGPTVAVTNNQFSPSPINVALNGTVTWQWNSGGVTHNVTFEDGPTSGNMSSGSFPRKFDVAGSYHYVCTIHAAEGMSGVVNVASGTTGSGGAGGDGGGGGGGGYP
jgi:plastocyanin